MEHARTRHPRVQLSSTYSKACIEARRRKESWKAASEYQRGFLFVPRNQLFRATHSLVGSTNERDTYVRRRSNMLKCRIA